MKLEEMGGGGEIRLLAAEGEKKMSAEKIEGKQPQKAY